MVDKLKCVLDFVKAFLGAFVGLLYVGYVVYIFNRLASEPCFAFRNSFFVAFVANVQEVFVAKCSRFFAFDRCKVVIKKCSFLRGVVIL